MGNEVRDVRGRLRDTQEDGTGAEDVTLAVMTAAQVLSDVSGRALARVDDTLTFAQLRVLVVLANDGAQKLTSVASTLGVNPSTTMRTVDKLADAGTVERRRNPASRREVIVELTERGRELVGAVMAHRRAEVAGLLAGLTEEQRDGLVAALRAFTAAGAVPGDEAAAALGRTGGPREAAGVAAP
ncbi:MarR family winged helix-turn-helix transcriptional regulator [Streptomyces sp. TR06-5]|uniref:MarR family winged helix-turn-helix transcriptional regulator n=1 Tax=unclassified Streptomyces TaxID=2593676 RepID=UPI0039A00F51